MTARYEKPSFRVVFVTGNAAAAAVAERACTGLRTAGTDARVLDPEGAPAEMAEDILFLSDDAGTARMLAGSGAKVVGFLHDGNQQESFSGFKFVFGEVDEVEADSYRKAWERLSGLPWTIARTERLLIRETTTGDLDALYDIYAEPSITEFQDGLLPDRDAEERYMEDYIKNIYGLLGCGIWSLVRLSDGALIGRAGLSAAGGFDSTELGFTVGRPWQRQGYAYEACSEALRFAEKVLLLDRVYASIRPGNTASVRLCEKLGFERTQEGAREGYDRYVIDLNRRRET